LSKNSENNLILKINVSRSLAAILVLTHLGAMILVAVAPVAWPLRPGVWALLVWSLYRSVRRHALRRGPDAVEEIEIDAAGELSVRLAGSATWRTGRLAASFVHPWLMLVSLRLDGRKWPVHVVAAADAVEPGVFRRWRVALRLRAAAE
jgi:toxin CptA